MSFERLIVCVDASGSMSGNKISNAKKLLLEVVKSFGCETKYFKFTGAPQELSSYQFSNLNAGGGTRVEYTLKELFGNHFRKWAHYGKNTKFIFVTDACDRITDVAGCISAKGNCVSAYGNKLDCECVLTGAGGGCSSELKQIFGNNAFHHCSDANFQQVLTAICGAINKANTISKTVLPNLQQEISNFANSQEQDKRKLGQDMQKIMNGIKDAKSKVDRGKEELNKAQRELNALNSSTPGIIADADRAVSPDQLTAAEEALESQTTAYESQYKNANTAGVFLDEAQKALETEGKKADQMAEDLSKKADEVSKKAAVIISNIITTIKELTGITTGAYQQVSHLKSKFNQQLSDLMAVVSKNDNLMEQFKDVKNKIKESFINYRKTDQELKDFKKVIASQILALNAALARVDSKW